MLGFWKVPGKYKCNIPLRVSLRDLFLFRFLFLYSFLLFPIEAYIFWCIQIGYGRLIDECSKVTLFLVHRFPLLSSSHILDSSVFFSSLSLPPTHEVSELFIAESLFRQNCDIFITLLVKFLLDLLQSRYESSGSVVTLDPPPLRLWVGLYIYIYIYI